MLSYKICLWIHFVYMLCFTKLITESYEWTLYSNQAVTTEEPRDVKINDRKCHFC